MNPKHLFASLLFALLFSFSHSQLVLNQYSYHFLDSVRLYGDGSCAPDYDYALIEDAWVDTFATGVQLAAVVTDTGGASAQIYGNTVAPGDTFWFDTTSTIPMYFWGPGSVKVEFWIVGTPTVAGEPYACEAMIGVTLALCGNSVLLFPPNSEDCNVDIAFAREPAVTRRWSISPNPSQGRLKIDSQGLSWTALTVWDLQGKRMGQWEPSTSIDLSHLPPGIYFAEISDGSVVQRERLVLSR